MLKLLFYFHYCDLFITYMVIDKEGSKMSAHSNSSMELTTTNTLDLICMNLVTYQVSQFFFTDSKQWYIKNSMHKINIRYMFWKANIYVSSTMCKI